MVSSVLSFMSWPPLPPSPAFKVALRHSARVRLFKRLLLTLAGGSVVGMGVFALWNPFHPAAPPEVLLADSVLNGSQITIEAPKLNGFRTDGRPYEVRAGSGVQDTKKPNVIQLRDLNAHFGSSEQEAMRVISGVGIYDSTIERMVLPKDVKVERENGDQMFLKNADMDFKAGSLISKDPARLMTKDLQIQSNEITLTQGGNHIEFKGRVRSVLSPPSAP